MTSLTLNAGWTDAPVTLTNQSNTVALSSYNHGYSLNGYWYPYYTPWWPEVHYHNVVAPPQRPIKLSMDEVERLRVAAKKDKALKETLEKFTDHIEVIVDFGKAE